MKRWGPLGLILAALLSVAAPAWALDPSQVLDGLRDHGKEWLTDKAKEGGKEWLFGTDQSAAMKAILDRVREESAKPDMRGQASETCKLPVYNQVFSVLSNLSYKTSFKEGASLVLTTGAKTIGLAVGGLGAAGEGGALDWLAGQYADAAKGQAEDSVFDRLEKLFSDDKAPEFEVFEQDGSCGLGDACTYELKAEWDIVHGRYYVYMHGDCHCSGQGAGAGVKVGEWWVSYSGPMLMKVGEDKKTITWVPGEPKVDMDVDCPCSHRKLRTAFAVKPTTSVTPGPSTATVTPPPPPPTTVDGWLKVTTHCEKCRPEADQINAAAKEREALNDEQNRAQTELEQAKSQVDIDSQGGDKELGIPAPTPAKVQADKAALGAAKAKVTALGAKGAALDAKLKSLWTKLKDCEKEKCGTYGMIVPGRTGSQAVAMGGGGIGCPAAAAVSQPSSPMDAAVLTEINRARTDPQGYGRTLKGVDAGEAVAFLERQAPLPPLAPDDRLTTAAHREAADQGPIGGASHTGTDGSTPMSRIQATCLYAMIVGEEISLAQAQATGVVRQLIIDATSPSHFHRGDLFSLSFKLAGVGCGRNKTYGEMCVIDLAATPMAD
ncbi:MAG TPA: CAP domain-containing protein [Caulobacteraceae bacterium]